MTRPGDGFPLRAIVDDGWGRKAVDFATSVILSGKIIGADQEDGAVAGNIPMLAA